MNGSAIDTRIRILNYIAKIADEYHPIQAMCLLYVLSEETMAGYYIHSIDWDQFQRFMNGDRTLVTEFAEACDEFDEEEGITADWPVGEPELVDVLIKHLAEPDWYSELSEFGQELFAAGMGEFLRESDALKGRGEADDSIYWPVIENACIFNLVKPGTINEKAVSTFGTRPYRFVPEPGYRRTSDKFMHSLHDPVEVQQMLQEFRDAKNFIMAEDEETQSDYTERVIPALEQILADNRMLLVHVDY